MTDQAQTIAIIAAALAGAFTGASITHAYYRSQAKRMARQAWHEARARWQKLYGFNP